MPTVEGPAGAQMSRCARMFVWGTGSLSVGLEHSTQIVSALIALQPTFLYPCSHFLIMFFMQYHFKFIAWAFEPHPRCRPRLCLCKNASPWLQPLRDRLFFSFLLTLLGSKTSLPEFHGGVVGGAHLLLFHASLKKYLWKTWQSLALTSVLCPEKPSKPQLSFTASMIQINRRLQKKSDFDALLTSLSSCFLLELGLFFFLNHFVSSLILLWRWKEKLASMLGYFSRRVDPNGSSFNYRKLEVPRLIQLSQQP